VTPKRSTAIVVVLKRVQVISRKSRTAEKRNRMVKCKRLSGRDDWCMVAQKPPAATELVTARSSRRPAIGLGRSSSHLDDDVFIAAGRNTIALSGSLASTGPGFHL
jgi:hypothetical protein